jgi:hypothetical protein
MHMPFRRNGAVLAVIAALLAITKVSAQYQAFPTKGQSATQQTRDEAECRSLAIEKSGFDPAAPRSVNSTKVPARVVVTRPPVAEAGSAAADATSASQDAEDALVAEVITASAARRAASRKAEQKQKQAVLSREAAQTEFQRTETACLESRGYRLGYTAK